MCSSDYNQIEFPTPRLPSCLSSTSTCTQPSLSFGVCFVITRHQLGQSVASISPKLSTLMLFSVSSDIFIFRWVGSDASVATAFMNTIDTNHLQVISQGRELNSQISPEAPVLKMLPTSCGCCFTYFLSFSCLHHPLLVAP